MTDRFGKRKVLTHALHQDAAALLEAYHLFVTIRAPRRGARLYETSPDLLKRQVTICIDHRCG